MTRPKPAPILFSEAYRAMHPDRPHVRLPGDAGTARPGDRAEVPDGPLTRHIESNGSQWHSPITTTGTNTNGNS